MGERKFFVLRQQYEEFDLRNELYNEIKCGRFRQGWGIKNLDLGRNKENWVKNFVQVALKEWEEEITPAQAENRYWILYPMLEINHDDIILVPKQPNDETFIVAQAKEREGKVYYFDDEDQSSRKLLGNDFRHVINIVPESVKELPYNANITTLLVKKKTRGYQRAVNNVWDEQFREAINNLFQAPEARSLPLLDVMTEAISPIHMEVLEKLRKLPPRELEKLVENIFSNAGLEVISGHVFDKVGGDIDIIFQIPMNLPSVVEIISPEIGPPIKLNIQIKQKDGIDFADNLGVEQLIKMSRGATNEYGILISTADDFTEECKRLAKQEKVILINGIKLAEIILKNL